MIHMNRYVGQAVAPQQQEATDIPQGQGETLLVVEDETAVLGMIKMMLERLGYRVLAAATPDEATRLAEEHGSEIRLLISDVVMPEMNGLALAERLYPLCPGMNILFMSGYTSEVIAPLGALDEGANFLPKPFSIRELAVKVRETVKKNEAAEGARLPLPR